MIETAKDMSFDDVSIRDVLKELEESSAIPADADPTYTDGFQKGFLLGLGTARTMVLNNGWSKDSILADLSASESTITEAPPVLTEAEAAEVAKEGAPTVELG